MIIRVTVPGEHHHRLLPSDLIRLGRDGGAGETHASLRVAEAAHLEWLPVDELHVHQVEVHRVNIGCRVVDFPDLGRTFQDHLGRRKFVGATETGAG